MKELFERAWNIQHDIEDLVVKEFKEKYPQFDMIILPNRGRPFWTNTNASGLEATLNIKFQDEKELVSFLNLCSDDPLVKITKSNLIDLIIIYRVLIYN